MKLQQLVYLREIARSGFSVSKAAKRLHTSQPSVSQQMLALERELRFNLFVREKGRLTGLTPEGQEVVLRAESVLLDIDYIRGLGQSARTDQGDLVIATTHTQARYVIPEALGRFAQRFPKVHVTLRHGNAEQIRQALEDGSADIGITPDSELRQGL
ncbi:MAG: LysR family transcriptional regulator [Betaproteobacteria bacterium]|nr:LysR family transcriptional regulator [Betaproteobacteria bacterium]